MLKLLPQETNIFHNLKCGEIYCLTSATYSVSCCLCGLKVQFEEFPTHFQQLHLSSIEDGQVNLLALKTDDDDPIKNDPIKQEIDEICDAGGVQKSSIIPEEYCEVQDDEKPIDLVELQKKSIDAIVPFMNEEELINVKQGEHDEEKAFSSDDGGDDDWLNEENADAGSSDDSDEDWKSSKPIIKNLPHPCTQCERTYKSKRSLQCHLRQCHDPTRTRKSRKSKKQKHKCNECGEEFPTERNLRGHMWKHTGIVCDICGKTFTQAGNMMRHKIRHTGVKAHKCPECDYSFYTEKELRAHSIRHTGVMPHICEICGRRCRDRGVLTAHMRRHTGERPAKCEVCGKCFYSFHDLNVHAVTHSTARPFSCDICGGTFQLKKALRVHKKVHSKVRNHTCKICGKSFAQSGSLNSHMRTHDAALSNVVVGNTTEIGVVPP